MNENLNLTEILKNCPNGRELFSPAYGVVRLKESDAGLTYPILVEYTDIEGAIEETNFTSDGKYLAKVAGGECILFPTKDDRDWAHWWKMVKEGDIVVMKSGIVRQFAKCLNREKIERWATKEEAEEWHRKNECCWTPSECKTGDQVLVKWSRTGWTMEFFSHIHGGVVIAGDCDSEPHLHDVIPLNDQTRHLVGTHDPAPVAFKWWND